MEAKPIESETIPEDPVSAFRKGKAKRESKRKEVKVITEYVPPTDGEPDHPAPPPKVPVPDPAPDPEPSNTILDVDSIADRVAAKLFDKMAVEKVEDREVQKTQTPPKVKRAPKEKKVKTPPPVPATKYCGWC